MAAPLFLGADDGNWSYIASRIKLGQPLLFVCFLVSVLAKSLAMQITYELEEKDFVDAYGIHRQRNWLTRWSGRIFITIVVLMTGLFIASAVADPAQRTARNILPLVALLAFWIVLLWLLPRLSVRRQFRKQPGAQGPRTVVLDAVGAHWRWNGGFSNVEWKNYIRWVDGKNQILFYTSPACFNILPKRALQPAQVTELTNVLTDNIQAAK